MIRAQRRTIEESLDLYRKQSLVWNDLVHTGMPSEHRRKVNDSRADETFIDEFLHAPRRTLDQESRSYYYPWLRVVVPLRQLGPRRCQQQRQVDKHWTLVLHHIVQHAMFGSRG